MPPLRGIERGIDGDMLKALEELGHGQRLAIVDPSYAIPDGNSVIKYAGDSSANALKGILDLVDVDVTSHIGTEEKLVIVSIMEPDTGDRRANATFSELEIIVMNRAIGSQVRSAYSMKRLGDPASGSAWGSLGFYAIVNNPETNTVFVRTRDPRPFACASFIVGHAQNG